MIYFLSFIIFTQLMGNFIIWSNLIVVLSSKKWRPLAYNTSSRQSVNIIQEFQAQQSQNQKINHLILRNMQKIIFQRVSSEIVFHLVGYLEFVMIFFNNKGLRFCAFSEPLGYFINIRHVYHKTFFIYTSKTLILTHF